MRFDIEKVIKNCRNCKENHRIVPYEHPAHATFIRSVGERKMIDLVFGLPLSEDGYNESLCHHRIFHKVCIR